MVKRLYLCRYMDYYCHLNCLETNCNLLQSSIEHNKVLTFGVLMISMAKRWENRYNNQIHFTTYAAKVWKFYVECVVKDSNIHWIKGNTKEAHSIQIEKVNKINRQLQNTKPNFDLSFLTRRKMTEIVIIKRVPLYIPFHFLSLKF